MKLLSSSLKTSNLSKYYEILAKIGCQKLSLYVVPKMRNF